MENCFLKIVILSHEFSAAFTWCLIPLVVSEPPNSETQFYLFSTLQLLKGSQKIAFNLYELIDVLRYDIKNWMPLLPDALYTAGTTSVDGTASTEREEKKSALQTLRDVLTEMQHPLEDTWHLYKFRWEKSDTKSISVFQCPQRSKALGHLGGPRYVICIFLIFFEAAHLGCISKFQPVEWLNISGPNRSPKSFDFPLNMVNRIKDQTGFSQKW